MEREEFVGRFRVGLRFPQYLDEVLVGLSRWWGAVWRGSYNRIGGLT
jgi:hypothetical protein